MDNQGKRILVLGATGNQGGATARHLLARGWQVRALSRNPDKPAAQELKAKGIDVVQGNLNDRASLERAMQGVYGVFSVQAFTEEGVEAEERQGRAVADAAKAAGVQHFIYSSVGGADRNTGIPHFESKWAVEQHVRALGLPATILRPVMFMDMFTMSGMMRSVMFSILSSLIRDEKPIQMIAADDIGAFSALAFEHPETYIGQAIEIAGDDLSLPQIRLVIRKIQGGFTPYMRLPNFVSARIPDEMRLMAKWFDESGYDADIDALRRVYPRLQTFESWLRRQNAVR